MEDVVNDELEWADIIKCKRNWRPFTPKISLVFPLLSAI